VSFSVKAGGIKDVDTITNVIKLAAVYLPIFVSQELYEEQTAGLRDLLTFLNREFDKSQAKKSLKQMQVSSNGHQSFCV
jgi:hypothetical protein